MSIPRFTDPANNPNAGADWAVNPLSNPGSYTSIGAKSPYIDYGYDGFGAGQSPYGANITDWANESQRLFRDDRTNRSILNNAINMVGGSGNLNDPFYQRMGQISQGLPLLYELLNGGSMDGAMPWLNAYLKSMSDPLGSAGNSPAFSYGEAMDVMNMFLNPTGAVAETLNTETPEYVAETLRQIMGAAGYTSMGAMAERALNNAINQAYSDYMAIPGAAAAEKAGGKFLDYVRNKGILERLSGVF